MQIAYAAVASLALKWYDYERKNVPYHLRENLA